MKVVHIFSASQSAFTFMRGQFEYLTNNAVDVSIIIPDDGFYDEVKALFSKCKVIKSNISRNISPFEDLKSLLFFIKLIYRLKPDIVHLHTPKAGLIGGLAAKLLWHNKVVFHLHGLVAVKGGKPVKGLIYYMEKLTLSITDRVLAVSPSLREYCILEGLVSSSKISVLNNGTINGIRPPAKVCDIDVQLLKQCMDLKEQFVIGFVGRLNEDKGIRTVIEVFESLADTYDVILCLVGPNELVVPIDTIIPCHLKPLVRIVDRVDNPYLYLSMFDIQLFPSVREGFGLVLAEASLVGTPSVAYDIFGIKDAVKNGATGTLVPFGNVDAMRIAVINYINNETLLKAHSHAGVEYISQTFNHESLCEAQLNFYRDFLND